PVGPGLLDRNSVLHTRNTILLTGRLQPFDDQRALDLACRRRAWQRVDDDETPRLLERRQAFAAEGAHRIDVGRIKPAPHHALAPLRGGYPNDRDFSDCRMRVEHGLDLARCNGFATGADYVAGAAHNRQVTLVVERAEIAGVIPAVAEYLRGRGRVIEVPVH